MSIIVTDSAKESLAKAMQDSEFKKPALRVMFSGFGWGGPRLGLALDELEDAADQIVRNNEIDILVDERVQGFIADGASLTVDYRETPYGAGFVIDGGSTCW